jgi:hypothetical protein
MTPTCQTKSVASAATADGKTNIAQGRGSIVKLILTVSATGRFFKFYDLAAAPASTDTPMLRVWVAAGQTVNIDFADAGGWPFNNGLGVRECTGGADSDTTYTSFAVSDSFANVEYQIDARP